MNGQVKNLAMVRSIAVQEAIDLSSCKVNEHGDRLMSFFVDGKDYCILETEQWIWSIGRHIVSGQIVASTSTKFYDNPNYDCLWLR